MAHTDQSCHTWMRHESWHIPASPITYGWLITYGWVIWSVSHGTYGSFMSRIDESWYIRMRHVTYGWVMSHMDEPCHILTKSASEYVMSHMIMSHMSCHIWKCHITYESNIPVKTATQCNTLQHTTAHCNTPLLSRHTCIESRTFCFKPRQ